MKMTLQEDDTVVEENLQHKCYLCKRKFKEKIHLREHILESHKTFQPCINFQKNTCEYNEDCRFRHVKIKENEHLCYKCGETFTSKTHLVTHIKAAHGEIPCEKYLKGECRFNERSCFFRHGGPSGGSTSQETPGG